VISVQEAIGRFRRDGAVSTVVKACFGAGVGVALALQFIPRVAVDPTLILLLLGGVWIALWYRTIKGSRLTAESSSLIASGRLEQAEAQIEQSLRAFSMSRAVKSMSLLNLALVRLAQKRWPETALLCREVLTVGGGKKGGAEQVSKSGRLMLADSLLEMGDLAGAYDALIGLYRYRLTLGEALNLLRVQTEYLARIGAWKELFENVRTKLDLAELMPPGNGVRVQAMLALAAKKLGRADWANRLARRVELLTDVRELAAERPILRELFREGEAASEPGFTATTEG
jgi:hypothetical protein